MSKVNANSQSSYLDLLSDLPESISSLGFKDDADELLTSSIKSFLIKGFDFSDIVGGIESYSDIDYSDFSVNDINVTLKKNSSKMVSDPGLEQTHSNLYRGLASKFIYELKNSFFEEGHLSSADHFLEGVFNKYDRDVTFDVINKAWLECYADENEMAYVHLLNVLQNISSVIGSDRLLTFAISALAHKNIAIKEAAIAAIESWDDPNHKEVLSQVADSGLKWLDNYKYKVIENIGL